jgi:NADPH:quinone reductase-like Zn-dependent oxidoreductase
MKAIRFHEYGPSSVLQLEDVPQPEPGPGDVLVRVHAASVNPVDCAIRAGYLKDLLKLSLPLTPGWDVSGVVESPGEFFQPGDQVWGKPDLTRAGSYAEFIVVKESDLAHRPAGIDHITAAAVPLAGLTAWQALFQYGALKLGGKVLIHAGAGGVGSFAIQFAKAKGLWVAATASGRNQDFLRDLGADLPINYETTRFEDVVSDLDAVIETMGGEIRQRSWQTLKQDGTLVAVIGPASQDPREKLMWVSSNRAQLDEIGSLIVAGKVKPIVQAVLPLTEARQAHELSETKRARGKIILRIA